MDKGKLFITRYIDQLEEHLQQTNPELAEELQIHSLVVHDLIESLYKIRKAILTELRHYDLSVASYIENGKLRK